MTKQCGIYVIENTTDGKCYVGSSIDVAVRWHSHLSALRRGNHQSRKLQKAFIESGEDAFGLRWVEFCVEDELAAREMYWIKRLDAVGSGYNSNPIVRRKRRLLRNYGEVLLRCRLPEVQVAWLGREMERTHRTEESILTDMVRFGISWKLSCERIEGLSDDEGDY